MARKVYHVTPDGTDWKVTHGGATISRHRTKDDAIAAARRLALANQPSQVVLHRKDGTIETEWTYGNDPYPPSG